MDRPGGQERYSTEVVIGRFNGQLTMLDGRSGGEWAAMPAAWRSRRWVALRRGNARRRRRVRRRRLAVAAGRHRGMRRRGGDLDDEIPF